MALLGNSYGSLCLKHAVLSGSTWTEEIVDATTGYSCSIAVDAAGKVYIAYHDPNTLKLRVAIRTP